MNAKLSRPDGLATVQSGREQAQSRVCTPGLRGTTRQEHVRNVDIWTETHVFRMAEFGRETSLKWFEYVQWRDKDDSTRNIYYR